MSVRRYIARVQAVEELSLRVWSQWECSGMWRLWQRVSQSSKLQIVAVVAVVVAAAVADVRSSYRPGMATLLRIR